MSQEITVAFVKQFSSNVFHLSQQKGSRLRARVRNESQRGESQFFERIGAATAIQKVSRHSDTPQIDTPHSRRRVTLKDFVYADLVDKEDKIRMLIDPTSEIALAAMWALGRSMDDEIIAAASGNAFGGVDGGTSVSLPNSQKIASVSGAAGANTNVQALRRAKRILDANDVDPDMIRYCALQSLNLENLLSETETTSADFNTVRALVMGELNTFLGFNFIRLERLATQSGTLNFNTTTGAVGSGGGDADGFRKVLAWAQDGLLLATARDIEGRIQERPDKNFSTQVFAALGIGSTRMEEEKVVEILSDES